MEGCNSSQGIVYNIFENSNQVKDTYGSDLIKIKDVCKILGISRNTIYSIQKKDKSFPSCIKFGHKRQARIFFKKIEIQKWILNLKAENSND